MAMSVILTGLILFSAVFGAVSGNGAAVSAGALEGAGAAVQLSISVAGAVCLWSGVMEVMRRSGLVSGLARIMRPLLRLLLPASAEDREILEAVSSNVSANLLGLGNAATPAGIRAVELMKKYAPAGRASDDMCTLIVLNTASIQLIPATVAGVRASLGSQSPFDILPAVWLTSAVSAGVGIMAAKIFRRIWRKK